MANWIEAKVRNNKTLENGTKKMVRFVLTVAT